MIKIYELELECIVNCAGNNARVLAVLSLIDRWRAAVHEYGWGMIDVFSYNYWVTVSFRFGWCQQENSQWRKSVCL